MSNIKHIAEFSLYTAVAFIFSYIESLIPLPFMFPGMKPGLANLVIVVVLYRKNFRYAFGLSMLRNLLNAFTFGSLFALLYSLSGSILSLVFMTLMKKITRTHFTVVSVSALGGIMHNTGQFFTAVFLVGFHSVLWYLPFLYFSGLATGVLIGYLSMEMLRRIPDKIR